VALLIIATTMLLAFWGRKVSLSWRMIAAAAFSLYIADMWFKFAQRPNYQSGDILVPQGGSQKSKVKSQN
jgi:hypothetical protein